MLTNIIMTFLSQCEEGLAVLVELIFIKKGLKLHKIQNGILNLPNLLLGADHSSSHEHVYFGWSNFITLLLAFRPIHLRSNQAAAKDYLHHIARMYEEEGESVSDLVHVHGSEQEGFPGEQAF